jgi:hypothetical protein
MADLGELTLESFSERIGERFAAFLIAEPGATEIPATDPSLPELVLAEAEPISSMVAPGGRRQAFSLVFRGPGDLILGQGMYRFENDRLGSLEIFIVPLQPDGDGARYEAVFT